MNNKHILVVGDLAVDRYYMGPSGGKSPEGPYLIVKNPNQRCNLGCAGNVSRNIKSMFPGISVDMMAVIGDDEMGECALSLLNESNINADLIFQLDTTTITKNRLVCDGVTLARWDDEQCDNATNKLELIQALANIASKYDIIVFSDYDKGMIFKNLITAARLNKNKECHILVDPKKDFSNYKDIYLIKPNLKEFTEYGCQRFINKEDIVSECINITSKYNIQHVLLTMAHEGMMLVSNDGSSLEFPTKALSVKDITGCGDLVISSLAGSLASGKSLISSIRTANIAAGINAGKFGTSLVTDLDIKERL